MSYSESFLHIRADFSSYVDEARPVSRMEAGETLAIGVAWTDGDEVLDITGAEVTAIAASASGQEVELSAGIDDGPLGRAIITDPPGTLSQGFWVIRLLLTLAGRSRQTSCRMQVLAAPQLQPGQPLPVAPRVIGSIDPVSVDEGTPVTPLVLTTVFDLGSPAAVLQLQEPVAGLSIVGTELRFDTSAAIATAAFTVVATNSVDSVSIASSFEVMATVIPVAPSVIGAIDPVSVEEGTPVQPIDLTTVFDLGSPAASLALQAPVAGLSIVGTELRFDTSAPRASSAFAVVATNAADSVNVTSSFEVTAAAGSADTATINDLSQPNLIYDSGAAFDRNAGSVPTSGTTTAPDGTNIEVRTVLASDGLTEVTPWQVVDQANGGTYSGTFTAPRGDWVRRQVRVAGSTAAPATETHRFAIGHVFAKVGQSEIDRIMVTGGGAYTGTLDPEQVQAVIGDANFVGGGSPGDDVESYTITRNYLGGGNGHAPKLTHAADMIQKVTADKVMIIDLALSASGIFQLTDDSTDRRRMADFLAVLDAAGRQDGVRPGVLVMMWTNADNQFATDYVRTYRPVFTGRAEDGSDYVLGTPYDVETFPGTPGTDNLNIKHDHILFDLTGRGLGIFDAAETRIALCHHRYDPNRDMRNHIINTAGMVLPDMWGQEIIRGTLRDMLDDPDFAQVMVRGTEPMNYENGTDTSGIWGDVIHPGQGPDGLQLFARHLAHAGLRALKLVPDTVPEFDSATFDVGGAFADFSWSGGPVTTTRKLRGDPDLDSTHPHWTDCAGFMFNEHVVEQAELQPDGSVRVYVPPGAGRGTAGAADWSKDRFFFGRGGGAGVVREQDDPLNGWWKNYPVIDAGAAGVPGLYDDTVQSVGGIAVRPLASHAVMSTAAYKTATAVIDGVAFRDDQDVQTRAGGGSASQFRFDLRAAFFDTQHITTLAAIGNDTQGNRVSFEVSRGLELKIVVWAQGGQSTAATLPLTPGVMHDITGQIDMVANTASIEVDGVEAVAHTVSGTRDSFINADRVQLLQTYGSGGGQKWHFQTAALRINDNGAASPPYQILDGSDAAALDAHSWRQPGGTILPFDQAPVAPAQPGRIDISSEQEMRDFLGVAKTNPTSVAGADVVLAPGLDLKGIQGDDWANAFIWSQDREQITIRSSDPANPALLYGVMMRPWLLGDGSITGNVRWKDIQFDFTHIPLMPPEWGNQTNLSRQAFESARENEIRDNVFEGCRWVGSFNEARIDNRDAQFRQIGIIVPWSTGLQILDCRFERINTGFIIAGEHILIDNVRTRHAWEDLGRLSTQRQNGVLADTRFVTMRRVVFWDAWSRHQLHPDACLQVDHYFGLTDPVVHGFADITDVLIEYCIYFPGVQIFQPAQPSGYGPVSQVMWDRMPVEGAHLEPLKMNRFRVSGNFVLPEGVPVGWKTAIQIEGSVDPTPVVTFTAPGGAVMTWHLNADAPTTSYTLDTKAETVEVKFDVDGWSLDPKRGGSNWLQTNFNDNGTKRRWTVRKCVIWGTTPNGISIQSNAEDFVVEDCTLLRPLPGDTTGNGRANTPKDRYSVMNHPRVFKRGLPESATIRRTVASTLFRDSGADATNFEMGYNDLTDLRANYDIEDSGDGVRHYPTTIAEAISMARPKPGSYIATNGIGALSDDPAVDSANWAWATAA